MRVGTPRFVGARLREAREARGLTAAMLSDLVGVSRQAISQYETGKSTPQPEVMTRIAQALNLPAEFFWRPVEGHEPRRIFFRSMAAATKNARTRAERRLEWMYEIVSYLEAFVQFPEVRLPMISSPDDPAAISDESIEDAAREVRRFWGLGDGPISNVVRLLEKNGIVVSSGAVDAETLDAFSSLSGERPCLFLTTDKKSAVRSRFDAAHELGHFVLHRNVSPRHFSSSSAHSLMERQAHRFAGAFLLPEETFVRDIGVCALSLDSFVAIKPKWLVSIGVMVKRSEDLGLLTEQDAKRLWKSYSVRGWRRHEPLDDQVAIEKPQLLQRAFEMLVDSGVQSRDEILEALPYSPSDIENLAGLPNGYLSDPLPELRLHDSAASGSAKKGRVIEFPARRSRGTTERQ